MARRARVVAPGIPHHVTQRGNRKQTTFFRRADYRLWLDLAAEAFAQAEVEVWAYCLMPNHVHLIATPSDEQGLARAVANTNVRYTRAINLREDWTGHLWQGRFASFAMDEDHFRRCVRYVGLNPVRGGIVARASDWPWSSVGAHLGGPVHPLLNPGPVAALLGNGASTYFEKDLPDDDRARLRQACIDGRPIGSETWVKTLEQQLGEPLSRPRRGRPPKKGDSHSFPDELGAGPQGNE